MMDLQSLMAYLQSLRDPQQANPSYAAQQVAGQGILGQGLRNQAAQIEAQAGGQPMPATAPAGLLGGSMGGQAQTMSPPPAPNAGAPSKEAIIAAVIASGDPVRIAQLKHMGWIK